MKYTVAIVGLCLAAPAYAHMQATTDKSATTVPAAPANLPKAIADLMAPRDLVVGKAAAGFNQQFDAQMAGNPGAAAMEQRYPGITAAIRDESRQFFLKAMGDDLPKLATRIAGIFADDFDLVEQRQVYDFLSSPAGHRMVASGDKMYDQDKLRKRAEQAAREGKGGSLTGADLAAAIDPSAMDRVPAADRAAFEEFVTSPGGMKFAVATPKLQQITAEWLNDLTTSHQPEMLAAIKAKVTAYITLSVKKP